MFFSAAALNCSGDGWDAVRKKGSAGDWNTEPIPPNSVSTLSNLEKLSRKQNGLCAFCRKPFGPLLPPTRDHIHKLVNGGSNHAKNLRLLCRGCHDVRHNLEMLCKFRSPLKEWVYIWIIGLIATDSIPEWFQEIRCLRSIPYWTSGYKIKIRSAFNQVHNRCAGQ